MSDPTFARDARLLIRAAPTASLATVDAETNDPFASLVALSTMPDGAPLLMLSALARHTRNIGRNSRVSILVTASPDGGSDPMTASRVTLTGSLRGDDSALAAARYLAAQPAARLYSGFSDFRFFRLQPDMVHGVAGFGRIVTSPATDILLPEPAATTLSRDAMATVDDSGHQGRIGAIDPDGFTDVSGGMATYRAFAAEVTDIDALWRAIAMVFTGI